VEGYGGLRGPPAVPTSPQAAGLTGSAADVRPPLRPPRGPTLADLDLGASLPTTPNPQLPTVQRLRVRYAKRGRLRFTSHRDIQRALERALRRAEIPMAYSQGFSPHPKVSYAGAAPTGSASEAEYLEIGLHERCDAAAVRRAIDEALPPGLDVVDIVEARRGALADRLTASVWSVELPGTAVADAAAAVAAFLDAERVEVSRLTRSGTRTFDARAAVARLEVAQSQSEGGPCAILRLVVRHGTPAVRPDDVLAGLRRAAGLEPAAPPMATRLAQGPFDEESGSVGDPLAPDRDVDPDGPADAAAPGPPAAG
jgi:radical SAM-linked protein